MVESAKAMRLRGGAGRGAEEGVGKRRDPARASRPKASDCASGFGREVMAHRRHTFMSATSSGSYLSAVRARQA